LIGKSSQAIRTIFAPCFSEVVKAHDFISLYHADSLVQTLAEGMLKVFTEVPMH
jgi:hypothetical protein